MTGRRPPRPDLDGGDRILVVAHRWHDLPDGGRAWLPCGGFRWRVVDRVVHDQWCGWQVYCCDPAPHHPTRESAAEIRAVLRAYGGERRPPAPEPVQLDLFDLQEVA